MDRQKLIDHHREVKIIVVFHFKRLSSIAHPGRSQFFGTLHILKECITDSTNPKPNTPSSPTSPQSCILGQRLFYFFPLFVSLSFILFLCPFPHTHTLKNIYLIHCFIFSMNEGAKSKPSVIQSAMLPSRAVRKKNFFRKHETISKQNVSFQMELLNLSHIILWVENQSVQTPYLAQPGLLTIILTTPPIYNLCINSKAKKGLFSCVRW